MNEKDIGSILIPKRLRKKIKPFWRLFNRIRSKNFSKSIDKTQIIAGLNKLNLRKGDLVWVHSSLSSFGHVTGGSETIISALKEVVGDEGTIVMPSFPGHGSDIDYLSKNPIFDYKTSPSMVGKISDVFWRQSGTIRSNHPLRSVAASGPLSEYITKDHELSESEYGHDTPFGKLFAGDSKILYLGAGIEKLSLYHFFEDTHSNFPFSVYANNKIQARWKSTNGKIKIKMVQAHNPELSRFRITHPKGIKLRKIFRDKLSDTGSLNSTKIGSAACILFTTTSLIQVCKILLNKGITIYNLPSNYWDKYN